MYVPKNCDRIQHSGWYLINTLRIFIEYDYYANAEKRKIIFLIEKIIFGYDRI